MKISSFIKMKNGNTKVNVINARGKEIVYEIANGADYGTPYGILLPNEDTYTNIMKGTGKKVYNDILKEIEKNKHIPIFNQ